MAEKAVDRIIAINGFSFSGSGQNAGLAFITLKDWSERGPEDSANALAQRINGKIFGIRDAIAFSLSPPPIQGLGNSSGFTFRLQDRAGVGQTALAAARDQLMAEARKSPILAGLRIEGMPDAAQVNLLIDREKANTFGVTFGDINSTITANLGSSYVNDFPNAGRMQRVTVQADGNQRMQTADLLKLNVRNGCVVRPRSSGTTAIRRSVSPVRPVRVTRRVTRLRKCSASPGSCRAASVTNGPASRCRKSSRVRRLPR